MNVGFVYQIQIWRTFFSLSKWVFMLAHLNSKSKHLIVAIGSECYVTLPKGQIIPTQSAAEHVDVPGGGHVLIVPITHYPTYSTIPPDLAQPIVEETDASAFL